MSGPFFSTRRVEFADTDMAGIAHFSRFFIYMEETEHAFWRSLGLSVHLEYEGQPLGWPRLATGCRSFKPVRFEDQLEVALWVEHKGRKSLRFEFLFVRDEIEVARGHLVTVCCICLPGAPPKAIEIPAFIADQVQEGAGPASR